MFLVYKFTCASCSSSYIGVTCRHFKANVALFYSVKSDLVCSDSSVRASFDKAPIEMKIFKFLS